jgi:hypothetical protein
MRCYTCWGQILLNQRDKVTQCFSSSLNEFIQQEIRKSPQNLILPLKLNNFPFEINGDIQLVLKYKENNAEIWERQDTFTPHDTIEKLAEDLNNRFQGYLNNMTRLVYDDMDPPRPTFYLRFLNDDNDNNKKGLSNLNKIIEKCNEKYLELWDTHEYYDLLYRLQF